jgi:hypothetical protein
MTNVKNSNPELEQIKQDLIHTANSEHVIVFHLSIPADVRELAGEASDISQEDMIALGEGLEWIKKGLYFATLYTARISARLLETWISDDIIFPDVDIIIILPVGWSHSPTANFVNQIINKSNGVFVRKGVITTKFVSRFEEPEA